MNQRIKELAEQAGAHETGHAYYRGEKKPENAVTLHSVDLEKFAELIVRECAKVCSEQRNPANLNYKPSEQFAEAVKQHFGVY